MFVRVVRFADVEAARMSEMVSRVEAADGPPEGVDTTRITALFDAEQGTAVVLQYFETAEAMRAGAEVFAAMDASDTPGTRATVDMTEVKLERTI